MGALTLKSFPFELRGWDIEKFESIDPTDGFGSNIRVYISKDQIVQIEPDYNIHTFNTWITDKGRQFFDGIFTTSKDGIPGKKSWSGIIKSIIQNLYMFDHCNKQQSKNYFFTIVFENLSLEMLSMLSIISQNYSFIKVKRAENLKVNNNLEANLQLNLASDKVKLSSSTLCLLISNNPRYEGYYLNLNLRQRFFKGNFKCLSVGSLIDLTFPVSFLGSNLRVVKSIAEGNHLICQDLKFSKNPMLIFNTELLKRNDGKNIIEILTALKYSNIFNQTWNGMNMLTPSLSETGTQISAKFDSLALKDLNNFSALYFLNVPTSNISNLKKIAELKLLNFSFGTNRQTQISKLFLDQNSNNNQNLLFYNNVNLTEEGNFNQYYHLPHSMFYENDETFVNTEGLIKRTTKLIFKKKTKNNWQILRKMLKHFKANLTFLSKKDNQILFFNSKKISNFKNFINFHYYATQTLTNMNFYFTLKTQPFILHKPISTFKPRSTKIIETKLKYWLDDFFSGGKDEYSQNSLILTNCSRILRSESSNFF
jgi:hypothetical protein